MTAPRKNVCQKQGIFVHEEVFLASFATLSTNQGLSSNLVGKFVLATALAFLHMKNIVDQLLLSLDGVRCASSLPKG